MVRAVMLVCAVSVLGGAAQDGGVASVPASRQADRVAIITIEGAIDQVTAMSVKRRIEEAESGGYGAMVFEIDSPGGGVGAVLEITGAIKSSSITNTVAWVNPEAFSGGAIIALACNEIVTSAPASMGDAFPVIPTIMGEGRSARPGLRGLAPDERTKLLPPLLADVTDSARRNGYDEYLVQAIVIDGIELWLVEDVETGARIAVNEREYRVIFGEEPVRGKPMIAEVTGGRATGVTAEDLESAARAAEEAAEEAEGEGSGETEAEAETEAETDAEDAAGVDESPAAGDVVEGEGQSDPNAFKPASDSLADVVREFGSSERIGELTIEPISTRPVFREGDGARYALVGYVTDGSAPIVMRDDQMIALGFSSGVVGTDEELARFMGAKEMDRADESWSERLVRFMTGMGVRYVLIAVLLIAVFVELITAGTGIGGTVALVALAGLLVPPMMIGMAGWWELIAIGAGIVCLLIEAFVTPGFGVFGVIGVVGLFAGVLGTFIPGGSSLSNPATQQDLLTGAVTIILALCTAGVVIWLIARNVERVPVLDRIVLGGASGVTSAAGIGGVFSAMAVDDVVRVGDEGVAATDLRPSGSAEIDGELVDVVSGLGYVDKGTRVRVTKVEAYRVVVDAIEDEGDA